VKFRDVKLVAQDNVHARILMTNALQAITYIVRASGRLLKSRGNVVF